MVMEISHRDHSELIGQDGVNVSKITHESMCKSIHFPDINRYKTLIRSNEVNITGTLESLKLTCHNIRKVSA